MSIDVQDNFAFDFVVFFGRSLAEYVDMFNLDLNDWYGRKILDCPGGPATFAMEAHAAGIEVVACDPGYGTPGDDLIALSKEQLLQIEKRHGKVRHLFDPDKPEINLDARRAVYKRFIEDYAQLSNQKRYIKAGLPTLPFKDNSFDLAVSGNLLFLYSDVSEGGMLINSPFDYEFHRQSLLELMRVAKEARFYPLKGPHSDSNVFFPRILDDLKAAGIDSEIVPAPYRDIKYAHQMLRIWK